MRSRLLVCGIALVLNAVGAQASRAVLPKALHTLVSAPVSAPGVARQLFPLKRHPVVALTFDDLPAAGGLAPDETRVDILTRLTKELRDNHLKGVYGFVNAVDLNDDSDTQQALRVWVGAGMNIGSHTWSHPSLTSETPAAYEHNIALDEPALRQYSRKRNWHSFRYPYLEAGDTVAKREEVRGWLHEHDYRIAEVSLNFEDDDWDDPYLRCKAKHDDAGIAWLKRTYLENAAEFIPLGREEEQIALGHEIPNVLLLHATDFTTLMLPSLMQLLRQEGFHFASLPKVEKNHAYAMDPAVGVADGGTFIQLVLMHRHLRPQSSGPEPVQELNGLCR